MIEKTDAKKLFALNIDRTDMLLEAIDKIKAYNQLYRMKQTDLKYMKLLKNVQDGQFEKIRSSCAEHAIISLSTAFETYYRELLQQLLSQFQNYFISKKTAYSSILFEMFNSKNPMNYEVIDSKLKLKNRFEYYAFFKAYNIAFLSTDEAELVEYIYMKRNNYVHNAGRTELKSQKKANMITPPITENVISTEAKRLRTKLKKMVIRSHERIILSLSEYSY